MITILVAVPILFPLIPAYAADADPAITINKQLTSVGNPLVSGTFKATKGASKIEVLIQDRLYPAQVPAPGIWIAIIDSKLDAGIYDVSARITDQAGRVAMDNTEGELIIDEAGPKVRVNELVTNDDTPQLSGAIEDASGVREATVKVGGEVIPATLSGTMWKAQVSTVLKPGVYDVTVEAIDALGNKTAGGGKNELVIDQCAPAITVDMAQSSNPSPALGGTVQDDHGTASVAVVVDRKQYTATSDGKGRWSLPEGTIEPGLAEGVYDIQATAKDVAGNTANDTTADELTIGGVIQGSNEEDKS